MAFHLSNTPEAGEKLVLMGIGVIAVAGGWIVAVWPPSPTRPLDGVPQPVTPISWFCGGPCGEEGWEPRKETLVGTFFTPTKNCMQFKAMHKYPRKCYKENVRSIREPEAGFVIEWKFTTTWNLIHYKGRLAVQIEGSKGCALQIYGIFSTAPQTLGSLLHRLRLCSDEGGHQVLLFGLQLSPKICHLEINTSVNRLLLLAVAFSVTIKSCGTTRLRILRKWGTTAWFCCYF